MLSNETTTAKYLCQQALNQSSTNDEDVEGRKEIFELMMNYEQIENEIIDDHEPNSEEW